jgi:integrase
MGSVTPYETGGGRRYRVRYRTPDRSQTDKRGFRTKREAQLFLASIEVTKARGEFVSAARSRVTTGEWALRWIDNQVQLKPSTKQGYESIVRTRIIPKWGMVPLADLSHSGVQDWLSAESLLVAPATVRAHHRVLSLMLKYAIRDGRLSRNVADGIRLPRIIHEPHGYLTHVQLRDLAKRSGEDGDVVLFLGYTGLRWGEMAALRVRDLDTARRRVNVMRAVTDVYGELVYGTPKNHSRRSVPYPSFLSEMLVTNCVGSPSSATT